MDIDLLNLGLRPPEPTVTPEVNTIASDKSQNSTPNFPAVPPGLSVSTTDLPSFPGHSLLEISSPTTPTLLTIPQSSDSTPKHGSPNPTPMTPTSLGRQIINTIRRAPSMSTTRPATNGTDRRSLADKSPRLSASSPGVAADPSHELPPPVPALPPNILPGPSLSSPSTFVASVNEPQKEEKGKEREKSRTGGNWFSKKRKSLRIGEKAGKHEPAPPAPHLVAEDSGHSQHQHPGWFNRSNSSTAVLKSHPASKTSFDILDSHDHSSGKGNSMQDRRPNGFEDFPPPSGSSTPSTTSLLIAGVGGATSPSMSTGSAPLDFSQPGRSNQFTTSLDRSQSNFDRKKVFKSYHPVSDSPSVTDHHPLPPLPPIPLDSPRSLPHNGYFLTSEPDMTSMDNLHAMEGKPLTPLRYQGSNVPPPLAPVSRSSTMPPTSLKVAGDLQDSRFLDQFSSPRSSSRKLSLTTTFNRKDRERDKR